MKKSNFICTAKNLINDFGKEMSGVVDLCLFMVDEKGKKTKVDRITVYMDCLPTSELSLVHLLVFNFDWHGKSRERLQHLMLYFMRKMYKPEVRIEASGSSNFEYQHHLCKAKSEVAFAYKFKLRFDKHLSSAVINRGDKKSFGESPFLPEVTCNVRNLFIVVFTFKKSIY